MNGWKEAHIIPVRFLFPKNCTNEIFPSKDFISQLTKTIYLLFSNANKNYPITF